MQHGDEDLIEAGRKFAELIDRAEAVPASKDDEFDSVVCEINQLVADSARLRATTERGVAVKARMAYYLNEASRGSDVTMDRGRDEYPLYDIFHSLLADMVPPEHRRVV
jgi:hypothetical protein